MSTQMLNVHRPEHTLIFVIFLSHKICSIYHDGMQGVSNGGRSGGLSRFICCLPGFKEWKKLSVLCVNEW